MPYTVDLLHPPVPVDTRQLRLDVALQLLEQSGHALPDPAQTPAQWLQALIDGLCDVSSRDALIGLANRRSFDTVLHREVDRVARAGEPALMLMIDIDHFKKINDEHGHAVGDLVLKCVARTLLDTVRPMDTVARVGGEEFAIILPNCPPAFGPTVAERVRRGVENTPVAIVPQQLVTVSVSVGGAFAPQWVRSSAALWIERADRQLYLAKASGRNRACLEEPVTLEVSAEEKELLFSASQVRDIE